MLAGLAGSEHAQHQHVASGAVGPRVWRHDIQNAVPLNGAFPDALVLADRVAARMPHQVADRLGDCLAPRPSPRSRSRLSEPCADRFKVLFRGGRKGDGARHLRWRGYCAGRRGGRSPSPSQASSQASRSRPVRPWPASSCALASAIISASRASRRARAAGVSGGGSRGPWAAGDGRGMGPNVGRPGTVCQRADGGGRR